MEGKQILYGCYMFSMVDGLVWREGKYETCWIKKRVEWYD